MNVGLSTDENKYLATSLRKIYGKNEPNNKALTFIGSEPAKDIQ